MLIHTEVLRLQRQKIKSSKVKGISDYQDGKTIVTYDQNQVLNFIIYVVEFLDGYIKSSAANTIDQNMYSQIDTDGYSCT